MIFDDLSFLREAISLGKPDDSKSLGYFQEKNLSENISSSFSPPLSVSMTLSLQATLDAASEIGNTKIRIPENDSSKANINKKDSMKHILAQNSVDPGNLFKPLLSNISLCNSSACALSAVLLNTSKVDKLTSGIELHVFAPQGECVTVVVDNKCTVLEVIERVLSEHESQDLRPHLDYENPSRYELRMDDGEGEPDFDFPAFENHQLIKDMNLRDFCLCEIHGDDDGFDSDDSDFPQANKKAQNDCDSDFGTPLNQNKGSSKKIENEIPENSVLIVIPNVCELLVSTWDGCRLHDLLPSIAKKQKLRLYTDEYIFAISNEDQRKLKYSSAIMNSNELLKNIGTRRFELQRRFYSDSVRLTKNARGLINESRKTEVVTFTSATAAVYQEWNVIKKNKYGKKQERVMGIDGSYVYNSRRGQFARQASGGVYNARKEISSIRRVDFTEGDKRTFRITWGENKEVYDVEYTCEGPSECIEIVSKLKFLTKRDRSLI